MLKFILMFQVCLTSAILETSWVLSLFDFCWRKQRTKQTMLCGERRFPTAKALWCFAFARDKIQNLDSSTMFFYHVHLKWLDQVHAVWLWMRRRQCTARNSRLGLSTGPSPEEQIKFGFDTLWVSQEAGIAIPHSVLCKWPCQHMMIIFLPPLFFFFPFLGLSLGSVLVSCSQRSSLSWSGFGVQPSPLTLPACSLHRG